MSIAYTVISYKYLKAENKNNINQRLPEGPLKIYQINGTTVI